MGIQSRKCSYKFLPVYKDYRPGTAAHAFNASTGRQRQGYTVRLTPQYSGLLVADVKMSLQHGCPSRVLENCFISCARGELRLLSTKRLITPCDFNYPSSGPRKTKMRKTGVRSVTQIQCYTTSRILYLKHQNLISTNPLGTTESASQLRQGSIWTVVWE